MKKIIILFICLTSSIWHVCAQTKVSGIVKDAQGMEMIGATVLQKGTNNGIVTGLDGKFTLTLSNKAEQTLLISMIGFIEQSIAIKKNHPFINITLEEDIAQLDEVVVVGYGTQKKVNLTGSVCHWVLYLVLICQNSLVVVRKYDPYGRSNKQSQGHLRLNIFP